MLITVCACLSACSNGPILQEVDGEVTLDGQAVKQGHLRFVPTDGRTLPGEAIIKDGKYAAKLTSGTYKVEIYSPGKGKIIKRLPGPGESAEQIEETIPARYNNNTEVRIDVTRERLRYDFPLKSN
jgi:hypothetical protein